MNKQLTRPSTQKRAEDCARRLRLLHGCAKCHTATSFGAPVLTLESATTHCGPPQPHTPHASSCAKATCPSRDWRIMAKLCLAVSSRLRSVGVGAGALRPTNGGTHCVGSVEKLGLPDPKGSKALEKGQPQKSWNPAASARFMSYFGSPFPGLGLLLPQPIQLGLRLILHVLQHLDLRSEMAV